ncbi:glycoside hydrolase [Sphingobacterium sp. SGG-5]|uniref:DUF6259 domain-containing protein n=1 Tax=Sphingobacterium sp. SGG-5 TaxID=2710881 RepID=UPI0013E9AD35|nr:DUF6259 domain-containing protein [Sphingobacterium sp. SGG-5]NGM61274.1 glycoside hydrolase [Sphingobacterium sp. SGG-5]
MKKLLFIALVVCSNTLIYAHAPLHIIQNKQQVSLSNGELLLKFESDDTFKFLGLSHNQGKTWSVARQQDLVWQLRMVNPSGSAVTLSSRNTEYQGVEVIEQRDRKSLVFSWLYPSVGGKIFMEVSIHRGNTLSDWDIRSEFPTGWMVDNLTFPIITLEKTAQQKMIMPAGWGAEYDVNTIANQQFLGRYPSSRHTIQLMLLHESKNTFYFATHDPKANLKEFSARVTSQDVEFSNGIVPSAAWTNNGKFNLPWSTSIGLSADGWEDAIIKWYRPFTFETEWGAKKLTEKQYPQWLINSDLWLTASTPSAAELQRTHNAITYFGTQTSFHWYYWHNAPFDTEYPEYFPAKPEFAGIIQEVQNRGSHVVPYINGRLWDVATSSYTNDGGREATVLNKDLTPYTETYASGATNAVICPSSLVWKQKLIELTSRIQGDELGTDGVYFDQVASARALPCWNPNHNHAPGGGSFWVDAYRDIFREVRAELSSGNMISTEQNAEPYLDMFDLFLMVNYPQGTVFEPVPLFPIIYSDRALLYGFYIYNKVNMSYRVKSALSLLWGSQIHGGQTVFTQYSNMVENAAFVRDLVAFRKRNHDLFVGGNLLKEITPQGDNPVLPAPNWPADASTTGTTPAVRGALWKSKNDQYAVVLVNVEEQPHSVSLPNGDIVNIKAGESLRIDISETQLNKF